MGAAGFDFTFKAKNGDKTVKGDCIRVGDGYKITWRKIPTSEESRARIKQVFKPSPKRYRVMVGQ
tara:strand:+ start:7365 stop:7559 length:195 start_codon:yes stop_codon:yes gene_type:complete